MGSEDKSLSELLAIAAAAAELERIKGMDANGFYQYLAENSWDETVEPLCPGPGRHMRGSQSRELFYQACAKVFGIEGVPGARKLMEAVYQDKHSYGLREVVLGLMDYVEVLREVQQVLRWRPWTALTVTEQEKVAAEFPGDVEIMTRTAFTYLVAGDLIERHTRREAW